MTNGQKLRKCREERGLTQEQARIVCDGVDIRTYQRWESGETKRVRSSYVEKVCKAKKKRA